MSDPERLVTQKDDLAKLLEAAERDVLEDARVEKVRHGLVGAGAFSVAKASAVKSTLALKIGAVVVAVGTVTTAVILSRPHHVEAPNIVPPVASTAIAAPIESVPPPPVETVQTTVSAPPPSIHRTPAPTATATSPREGLLLLQARQALATDPQRALDLVKQHEREFPKSQLTPERNKLREDAIHAGARP
jgi:hypothetical protein